jgi:Ca-activated chloride channel family protein
MMAKPSMTSAGEAGGRLVATDGRELVLRGASLRADAAGGLASVVLEQRFTNPYADALAVTYQLPLPADAAVSGFAFRIGDRCVRGEIDRTERARERFEEALVEGREAALLEQDRSSLFTQEIGNIPGHAEVVSEIRVDQLLAWLPSGSWEWRFPSVVAPRYLGAQHRVADAGRLAVDVAAAGTATTLAARLVLRDNLTPGGLPESPSHAIETLENGGPLVVCCEDAALDRDVVVRWPVARPGFGATLELARPPQGHPRQNSSFGLLTVVPPVPESAPDPLPRDLVVLLDTSGSMHGAPLDQAREVAAALVESLSERDRLELIGFSLEAFRFRPEPVPATPAMRAEALEWLGKLEAGGGTEMGAGLQEALRGMRPGAQRQVVLVSDGLVGFEQEMVSVVRGGLPRGCRLHSVGVGSAPNRSLTAALARAGGGVELLVGLDEPAREAADRLLAHTARPLAVDVDVEGSALRARAPERLGDILAGAPARLSLELDPAGGELRIFGRADSGPWERRLAVPPAECGTGDAALARRYARECVEDLEMHGASGKGRRHDPEITALGLDFGISTRLTSWVAIAEEPGVDPRAPLRRERLAQSLPHGMSVARLGLRGVAAVPPFFAETFGNTLSPRGGVRGVRGRSHRIGVELRCAGEPRIRILRGRLAVHRGRRLVVEIRVESEPLDWRIPERVRALGARFALRARCVAGETTRPGTYATGTTVRLGLRLVFPWDSHVEAARPQALELLIDGRRLRVELE